MATTANLPPGAMPVDGYRDSDPFVSSSVSDAQRHRYSAYDNQQFSLYSNGSPSQTKRALQAHLAETERRLQEASHLGTELVQQRKLLTDRLKEVERQQEENEIGPELRQKLVELEREFNEVGRETARVFIPKARASSNETTTDSVNSASVLSSEAHHSPTKVHAPSRKQRNQAPTHINDMKLMTEIGSSLLVQLRELQGVLAEKDEALKNTSLEKSQLEVEVEGLAQRIRALDESDQRYKDENWSLETQLQELIAASKQAGDREQRLNQNLNSAKSEKADVERELEELKQIHAKVSDDHAATRKQHEVELSGLRRNVNVGETERDELQRKIEELTSQNQELAKAVAYRVRAQEQAAMRDPPSEAEDTAPDHTTPEHSPPPSPTKGTPRHGQLESETLKSSLHHAHRMIQNLKNNIHREKTEKIELKRMLQDARDELEMRRSDGGINGVNSAGKKRKSGTQQDIFKKPVRPDRLGALRNSRNEIIHDDGEWEDHEGVETPSRTASVRATTPGAPGTSQWVVPSQTVKAANDTTTENSDALDTANERDGTATETEAFQTGAETLDGDSSDELTETEAAASGDAASHTRRPSPLMHMKPSDRFSYISTASTSGDELDDVSVRTPVQALQPRYRLRVSRGAYRRSNRTSSDLFTNTPPGAQDSPASVVSNQSQAAGGQSLFAELGNLSDRESEEGSLADGTPSRASIASPDPPSEVRRSGTVVARPQREGSALSRPQMVDSGVMTDPWEPKGILANASEVIGAALAGGIGFGLGRAIIDDEAHSQPATASTITAENNVATGHTGQELPTAKADPVTSNITNSEPANSPSTEAPLGLSTIISEHTEPSKPTPEASPIPAAHTTAVEQSRSSAANQPSLFEIENESLKTELAQMRTQYGLQAQDWSAKEASLQQFEREAATKHNQLQDQNKALLTQLAEIKAFYEMNAMDRDNDHSKELAELRHMKEQEVSGLEEVVERLQGEIQRLQRDDHHVKASKEAEVADLNMVIDDLQKELRALQQQFVDFELVKEAEIKKRDAMVENLQQDLLMSQQREQAKAASFQEDTLTISDIAGQDTEPVEKPRPVTAIQVPIPGSESAKPGLGFFSSMLAWNKSTGPSDTRIAEDGTSQPSHVIEDVENLTSDKDASVSTNEAPKGGRIPLMPITGNDIQAGSGASRDLVIIPKPTKPSTADEATQTLVSAGDIDKLMQERGAAPVPVLVPTPQTNGMPSPTKPASGSSSPRRSRDSTNAAEAAAFKSMRKSGSPGSLRSRPATPPPLPPDHKQAIAAAAQKPLPAGSMGPPTMPASAYKSSTHRRSRTPTAGPVSPTSKGGTTPRPRFNTMRSDASGTSITHRSSVSSFASELDQRFNIGRNNLDHSAFDPNTTDPRMIQAITQTMIGEYLWKYTRKAGRGEMSENRHKRFFWVHPYTRTLYWSEQDPATAGRAQLKAKSVAIEAVRVVTDDNPMPPGLHRKSLVVITPGRSIKFTAQTGQRHETWFNALSYLLLRTSQERDDEEAAAANHLTAADVDEFNPPFGRSISRITGRSRASLSSYNSRTTRTSSPQRHNPSLAVRQSAAAQRSSPGHGHGNSQQEQQPPTSPSRHNNSSMSGRLSSLSGMFRSHSSMRGSFSSRRSRHSMSVGVASADAGAIYDAPVVHDSAEDLRQVIEQQEREADRLENVRACCDGKHDVGSLSRAGGAGTGGRGSRAGRHGGVHAHAGAPGAAREGGPAASLSGMYRHQDELEGAHSGTG